jgi:hypothetical protein
MRSAADDLKSVLQFHLDDEILAWRTIGLAGRAAIELGLHRRETYPMRFSDVEQRVRVTQLFWSIYVLDRRWSFVTGRSFAIPESDIDLDPPKSVSASSRFDSHIWDWVCTQLSLLERLGFIHLLHYGCVRAIGVESVEIDLENHR